jgi:hypothetical protein
MTAWGCRDVEAKLADALDDRLDPVASVRLHDHLESCATCRARAALWRDLTPALRALEPAPPAAMAARRMQIEIERRLATLAAAPARPRWRWAWIPALAGVAAAAAAMLLWVQRGRQPATDGYARIARLSGALTAGPRVLGPSMVVPTGTPLALAAGAETELTLDRGTVVHVVGPAHVALTGTAAAVSIRLDDGSLTAAVAHRQPGQTFAVVTSDLQVEVKGTRFSVVKSGFGNGGSTVHVDEGKVLVRFVDGRTRFVSAGESAASLEPEEAPPPPADEAPPPVVDATPVVDAQPAVVDAPPARVATCAGALRACRDTTATVRSTMRGGAPERALHLLAERGHAAAELDGRCGGEPLGACQDELRYLHAEALNQAGRLDDAIAAYRALDRRGAPAAMRQNALYAAAQIERRHGHGDDARVDYERALEVAPRGALREEILIGAMETEQAAGNSGRASALAHRYLGEFPGGIGAPTARRLAGGAPR